MNSRRVVVTGIGIISALGKDRKAFQDAIFSGRSGIDEMTIPEVSELRFKKGAQIRGFVEKEYFEEKQLMLLDRFAQFALVAAREAIEGSGITWETRSERQRTAIITGTGTGGQVNQDEVYIDIYKREKKRLHPLIVPRVMSNAGASHISMEFGITGPTYTITTACSSASHAIGQAFWSVRNGLVDRAITGGSETPFGFANLKAWEGMRVVSPDTCRPFCRDRSGMILGEGGAMLFLETLESARKRGAEIYAEIVGFGMSADAHHITQPSEEGAAEAIRFALEDGKTNPEEIGYINAHGTATQANDVMETEAIRQVFGDQAKRLAVSSTKSMHGHTLGAAGAIEAVATVLALKNGVLPPTANFTEADPECDLDYIPNEAREVKVEAALSNSFAFGGLNAVLAFKRFHG
ncbi:MAG: beta-ketoacyl-[acyl-carrier-protein] synthase family protein [Pyrinomonadaceae bacterium]